MHLQTIFAERFHHEPKVVIIMFSSSYQQQLESVGQEILKTLNSHFKACFCC